jgi:hypothetical protein
MSRFFRGRLRVAVLSVGVRHLRNVTRVSPGARTGALAIPRPEGGTWLQLLTLPAVAEGSELVVRVDVSDLEGASRATFRAFIGVSER